jgi:hypothetical protein
MDKFSDPVLKEKKWDTKREYVGAKHSAAGTLLILRGMDLALSIKRTYQANKYLS